MKPIPITQLDGEGRRLMARAAELIRQSAYESVFSGFLTPREQRIFCAAAESEGEADRLFFWGGAPGAERRAAVLLPDWLLTDAPPEDPLSAAREAFLARLAEEEIADLSPAAAPLSLCADPYARLTHRDWLGSILALGLERHVLGDIAVLDGTHAVAFFAPRIAPFVEENLHRAGNGTVSASPAALPAGFEIPRSFERVEVSVASPRLDGVVRALTGLSRADAAALVRADAVELNYFPEENTDAPVTDGDVLSIRGFGKYIVDSASGVTRRGRNRLCARKYV